MADTMNGKEAQKIIDGVYERIMERAEEGRGTNLSAREVAALANFDPAVYRRGDYLSDLRDPDEEDDGE